MEDVPHVVLGCGASQVEEVLGLPAVVHLGSIPDTRSREGYGRYR